MDSTALVTETIDLHAMDQRLVDSATHKIVRQIEEFMMRDPENTWAPIGEVTSGNGFDAYVVLAKSAATRRNSDSIEKTLIKGFQLLHNLETALVTREFDATVAGS